MVENVTERDALETAYRALADRARDKASELREAEAAHAETVAALVDGKGKRSDVLAKRAALAVDVDALREEVAELTRRRDVADLVRFEYELAEAERELQAVAATSTEARHAMDAAMEARGRSYNAPARRGETPESARRLAELEVSVTRTRAESSIAARDVERARARRDDAAAALAEAHRRLGVRAPEG